MDLAPRSNRCLAPTAFARAASILLGVLSIGATIPPALQQTSSPCESAKARELRGKPYSEELAQEAQRLSGARVARPIGPGIISSADRIPNRLNIELDPARMVRDFWCE